MHSNLIKPDFKDLVFVVIEAVISVTPTKKKRSDASKRIVVSGGYVHAEVGKLSSSLSNATQMQFMKGTPRELIQDIKFKSGGTKSSIETGAYISMALLKYKPFQKVAKLIPCNSLVTFREMIPGLVKNGGRLRTLPLPVFGKSSKGDQKKDQSHDVDCQNEDEIFIHNLQIDCSPTDIETIITEVVSARAA